MPSRWCHYSYTVLENNIIDIKLVGTFGVEASKRYVKELTPVIEGFNGAPFKLIIDISEWEGSTPDAYKKSAEFGNWMNEQGIVAKAYVSDSKFKIDMAMSFNKTLHEGNFKPFCNRDEALEWVRSFND